MSTCAVIPAAGRGSRLGLDRPKILARLSATDTVWSILRQRLLTVVEHVHVVLSPEGAIQFQQLYAGDIANGQVSISIQFPPIGMGDAIFGSYGHWSSANSLLVIWGDQVWVSADIMARTVAAHAGLARTAIVPVVTLREPYVQYLFDSNEQLVDVKQSREGNICDQYGLNDIGTFVLSIEGIFDTWQQYLDFGACGSATGEINFLPFLPFLALAGWTVRKLLISEERAARGINTPEDLRYFRQLFDEAPAGGSDSKHEANGKR
jgi:bifunctional UDP-N-acetylglucosamine pyrophosphorylase/glucosamine-1-phosphate N-acetyltransferase